MCSGLTTVAGSLTQNGRRIPRRAPAAWFGAITGVSVNGDRHESQDTARTVVDIGIFDAKTGSMIRISGATR